MAVNQLQSVSHVAAFIAPLAVYDWAWLSIFVACLLILVSISFIILMTVWLTGGLSGRK
jgi:hypothetical protein